MLKRLTGFSIPIICCLTSTFFFYNHNLAFGVFTLVVATVSLAIFPVTRTTFKPTSPVLNKLIGFIILCYLFINIISLYQVPLIVDGDASHQALVAQQSWSEKWQINGCCFKGEMSNAYLYFLGGWLKSFPGLLGLRLFSFVWGVLGSVVLYHLTKKIFGLSNKINNIPLYSAMVYLTLPFAQYFFRSGLELTLIMFSILLSLYFFIHAWETKRVWYLFIPSLLIGFGFYIGPQIKFWPVLVFLSWLLLLSYSKEKLKVKGFLKFWSITLVMLSLSVLCYLPILSKFGFKQVITGIRANQVSNLEVMQGESAVQYEKIQQILIDSGRSAIAFFYPIGLSGLFFIRSPYLNFIHAFLLLLGWIFVFIFNKRIALYLTSWYVLGAIIAGGFTVGSPTSSRMIINLPVVAIFIACGVSYLEQISGTLKINRQWIIRLILILAVFVYGWLTTDNYFKVEYVNNSNQYDYISSTVGRYLMEGNFYDKKIYMLTNGYYYYSSVMSLRFLSNRVGIDISEAEQPRLKEFIKETNNNLIIVPYWYQGFVNEVQKNIANDVAVTEIKRVDGSPSSFIITN